MDDIARDHSGLLFNLKLAEANLKDAQERIEFLELKEETYSVGCGETIRYDAFDDGKAVKFSPRNFTVNERAVSSDADERPDFNKG